MNRIFQVYIVPAAVFVSVVIGGGYGTGRELTCGMEISPCSADPSEN
jgi:hypothetical protein